MPTTTTQQEIDELKRRLEYLREQAEDEIRQKLAQARQVVGLDTGFSHLAAAFGAPTIGIYCDHEPGQAGIAGPGPVASFGGVGKVPSLDEVMAQLERHLWR